MVIIVWLIIFLLVNIFSYLYFYGIDIICKYKHKILIHLKFFNFIFIRYKKKDKEYISKKSLIFQIIHLVFTISIFLLLIVDTFVIKYSIISLICFYLIVLYLIIMTILPLTIASKVKECLDNIKNY